jgi:DNA replication protein DnaC
MLYLPSLPGGLRPLTTAETERLEALYPDLPAGPEHCITCGGKGEFQWYVPGGQLVHGENPVGTYECSCTDQWVAHRYFLHCGIKINYQRLGWPNLKNKDNDAVQAATRYMLKASDMVSTGFGLIFWGLHGTGKTLLATLMLKQLLGSGYDGYSTTFNDAIDMFQAGWRDPEEKRWYYSRVKNAGVLLIDDLARESKNRIEQSTTTVDEILRSRVADARPTILTTNANPDQFGERYNSGIVSLLHECSAAYAVPGDDYRAQHRKHLEQIVDLGLRAPITYG